ncbi:MAG: hypothetical protein ACKOBG_11860 [Actinomycetota bacterium]
MSTEEPRTLPTCAVCRTVVTADAARCPVCGLDRPAARGSSVLGRQALWTLAGAVAVVYVVVLAIVAAAR